MNNHTIWTAKTTRVNIDTGLVITKQQSNKLIKVKTRKHATVNRNKTKGIIEYTIEYRDNPQLGIFSNE